MDMPIQYFFIDAIRRLVEERWVPHQHLIAQYPARPPVCRLSVAIRLNNFGSKVFRRATKGPGTVVYDFGEPEIGQAEVSAGVEEEVLGLEIAVDDVEGVEILEGEDDGGEVEAGDVGGETLCAAEVGEEFSAGDVGKEHVDVEAVLESGEEVDDEGVVHAGEDVAFGVDVLYLAQADDFGFSEDFHGEEVLGTRRGY